MTMRSACEMARFCGLSTVGEALTNVQLHALNLFPYGQMNETLLALEREFAEYAPDTLIVTTYPDLEDV